MNKFNTIFTVFSIIGLSQGAQIRTIVGQSSNAFSDHPGGTSLAAGSAYLEGLRGRPNLASQASLAAAGNYGLALAQGTSTAFNGNAQQNSAAISGFGGTSLADGKANAFNGHASQNSLAVTQGEGSSIANGAATAIGGSANQQSAAIGGSLAIAQGSATSYNSQRTKRGLPEGCSVDIVSTQVSLTKAIKETLKEALLGTTNKIPSMNDTKNDTSLTQMTKPKLNESDSKSSLGHNEKISSTDSNVGPTTSPISEETSSPPSEHLREKRSHKVHNAIAISGYEGYSQANALSLITGDIGSADANSLAQSGKKGTSHAHSESGVDTIIKRDTEGVKKECPSSFQKEVTDAVDEAVLKVLMKFAN